MYQSIVWLQDTFYISLICRYCIIVYVYMFVLLYAYCNQIIIIRSNINISSSSFEYNIVYNRENKYNLSADNLQMYFVFDF